MTIDLDQTIIPSRDKEAAARFFAQAFGFRDKWARERAKGGS